MMELHVPSGPRVLALATVVGHITDGLDAVVLAHESSALYEGSYHLTLDGNPRDLAIAAGRAIELGGVVD